MPLSKLIQRVLRPMYPCEFPEQTVVFAKDQPEYLPLPAHISLADAEGEMICCWKLNLWERVKLLWTGRIWHSVWTFNQPLQPQLLSVGKPAKLTAPANLVSVDFK